MLTGSAACGGRDWEPRVGGGGGAYGGPCRGGMGGDRTTGQVLSVDPSFSFCRLEIVKTSMDNKTR